MSPNTSRRWFIVFALVAVVAVPAARAAVTGCPADTKLVNATTATLSRSFSLSGEQAKILQQLVSLESARQDVPADLLDRMRTLTTQNRRVIVTGEKRLAALPPGTPQGRAFKRAALRYLREGLQPENECMGQAAAATTVAQSGASLACFEAAKRKEATLQRLVNATLVKMKGTRRCTIPHRL